MNNEQLQKGTDLKQKIESVKAQKEKWENSKGIWSVILSKEESGRTEDFRQVHTQDINFNVLKALTLDTINKKLSELEEEFGNL